MVFLAVCLQSSGPVLAQSSSVSGVVFSFWRLWFGVSVLGLAAVSHVRISGRRLQAGAWKWMVAGGFAFGASQAMSFSALKATSVSDVTLMLAIGPIVVALLAVPLYGERPGRLFVGWTVVAISGVVVVVLGAAAGPDGDPMGMAMAASAVLLFSLFFLVSKSGRDRIDVLPFLFGVTFFGAVVVSTVALLLGEPVQDLTRRDALLAIAVAIGPGSVGHFAATWPLRWLTANVPPVLRLMAPILSGALAWLLLGEPVTAAHLLGGTLTLGGVAGAILSVRRAQRVQAIAAPISEQ
jgi:drug/metabolite transporter (DMT)-like permease